MNDLLPLETRHPGVMPIETDEGESRPSRWITLRAWRGNVWWWYVATASVLAGLYMFVPPLKGYAVVINVIGGIGTLVGPILGAGFFLLLREALSRFFTEYYLIPVGVIFIAMVIFMPQGLLGFARRWLNR